MEKATVRKPVAFFVTHPGRVDGYAVHAFKQCLRGADVR